MTYLLKAVRDYLVTSAEVAEKFCDRIYPDRAPQAAAYPFLNLSDLSNDPEEGLSGEVGNHESIITVDIWTDGGLGAPEANQLGEVVRNMLSGYKGALNDDVWCNGCHVIRNQSLASDPLPGSDTHRRRVSQDYRIFHTADIPSFT